MGKLSEEFRKWFQKPWSSIYSTEVFTKGFLGQMETWGYGRKELVVLEKGIGVSL
jgi:hypothetical protein